MADLRVGVVGMGIGQLHLASWSEVTGAEVVAIADTDPERRVRAASDWGVAAVESIDQLLGTPIDVLDICTPPALHEEHIVAGLAAGVHVICEKPFVDSLDAIRTGSCRRRPGLRRGRGAPDADPAIPLR